MLNEYALAGGARRLPVKPRSSNPSPAEFASITCSRPYESIRLDLLQDVGRPASNAVYGNNRGKDRSLQSKDV